MSFESIGIGDEKMARMRGKGGKERKNDGEKRRMIMSQLINL